MADPHNVEFEAAKFLQKLIHESTDEPAKLATKLYVILQHMKASGKENSMPYQVISRAMETVINQHGLDIEALMSSRLPLSSGSHVGESARPQPAGCSQAGGIATDSKSGMIDNDTTRPDGFGSGRPPAGPSSVGNDPFQGSISQRSARSFDHESPSSMDTRSTNSYSQDRREQPGWEQQGIQKDIKRPNIKRKRSDTSGIDTQDDITQQLDPHSGVPDVRKEKLTIKSEAGGTLLVDPESWKQGFFKGATSVHERAVPGHLSTSVQADIAMRNLNAASSLDAAGVSNIPPNTDRLSQGGNPSNLYEVGTPGSSASRDPGKFPAVPACATGMPFKEHHLQQLRAQCLVFLAFRNGLSPKKPHLDIALGNILLKEGSSGCVDGAQNELIKDKGKQHTTFESSSISEVPLPLGTLANVKSDGIPAVSTAVLDVKADLVSKEAENVKLVGKPYLLTDPSRTDGETKLPPGNGMLEDDTKSLETANSSALMTGSLQPDTSGMRSPATIIHDEHPGGPSHAASVISMNKQLKPDMRWSRVNHNDLSRVPLHTSIHHDLGSSNESSLMFSQREGNFQSQQRADSQYSTSWKSIQSVDIGHHRARQVNDANLLLRNALHDGNGSLEIQTRPIPDGSKVVPMSDSSFLRKDSTALGPMDKLSEPEEEEQSMSDNLHPSPKYTLSEKWIMAHQKRKLATQQKWVQKLQKADQRISTCFDELKETVSSSADISAKTRSVIELKKLQLLELQRCLRSNILSDFFKPIQTEMDRLKSIKKHRIGRRMKHVEKYEQKMKEERQKRIRERQKEFFSEVEVHKERLEDVFKFKRERCKGFNRYVKEFHKRKERIHREKIDRIQREKINLLKINDVEGYLRMVQDAKSDRVKQLLKETEKYLLKLGSKLKEAKAAARQVEMDENRIATIDESNDIFTETEDENDQAKHYKESNEKYYLIAHSIKESIAEQPTGLRGGKLREYQMNGLRWLVSLYNNHLNGILADEMGLGKTVQVISLICYLMENKNDRGPFLVVVPSSVLPGWEQELSFWAPGINKIVYAGPPEERRRLFKESIIHQKFNVLLTTYEYLMNKHDRPKLSKLNWHYIIIDEGHRIKNASCKLNADLKLYHSSHRLLLTGTPLQNNLEELWALLNFLLPNIFNSSEDFSQWFNKPFESNGDSSPDEALLSEEENLLIINRLHQVLRPFVLRRLKHKVENELPEKIERLVRCEASAYQKLLMKRVEENLGALGVSKARAVHNSVMELRNICNHPYLSQLHAEEVDKLMPKHFLPPIVRLCGKLEMLDRLLPKLKATNHRVLFFSTMTRLLDVMEEYLGWKQYQYLRLDGHTSGLDRGALIEKFNQPDSPYFIFLLSIRAGGVGVNLQAADTVIIFDTDWNPQVDLQAQARAHRIGQKKDVLVLRLETVHTVEEQVRAAAEHKLGVANQSITAGFFDNNTSAEDRREYLESLLRESKKEEAAPVLDDDSLNDILARSESEIDAFEEVDQKRREEEMATWKKLLVEKDDECSEGPPPLPSRLVTEDDLKAFYEAMKLYEVADDGAASGSGMKRKSGSLGGFDTQQYGRGKRAREVRSYEEQWTEEEFEKICQAESPETPKPKGEKTDISLVSDSGQTAGKVELSLQTSQAPPSLESLPPIKNEVTPPVKRGRGRPRRMPAGVSSSRIKSSPIGAIKPETQVQKVIVSSTVNSSGLESVITKNDDGDNHQADVVYSDSSKAVPPLLPADPGAHSNTGSTSVATQPKRQGRKGQPMDKNIDGNSGTESIKRRGRKPSRVLPPVVTGSHIHDEKVKEEPPKQPSADVSVPKHVLAECPVGAESKSLKAGTSIAVEDLRDSELSIKQTSCETSSVTVPPVTATERSKSNTMSNSDNASIQESASVAADAAAHDPKLNESFAALLPAEASVKGKGDPVLKDKVEPVTISDSPAVGSLSSCKTGTKPNEVSPQAPSSEIVLPSPVGPRPGRRQSKKPQSGIEPVQRRGRKRGRAVSTASAPPDAQDKNLNDPVKSGNVTYVAASSEPAKMVMSSPVASVPVIPLVPVSGFTLGATPLTGISGSVHHVSMGSASELNTPATSQSSPAIPPEIPKMPVALKIEGQDQKSQSGEKVPRRRGRKKSAAESPADNSSSQCLTAKLSDRSSGDSVDRKVIRTRSRQLNISLANNAQEEKHVGNTPTALTSTGFETIKSPNLSSNVRVSSSLLEPAFIKADAGSKPQQSRCANPMEEITLCRSPAEIPPISCKGKTNVIVLALELTGPAVSCSRVDSKEECSDLQKDFARNVKPKVDVSGLEVSCAAGVPAPLVDEELSAPPGFDTPRAGMSDSAARKSSESYDTGKFKICDAKSGSVVLALESTTITVDPSSTVCQNVSEKEESSELSKAEFKELGKQSISSGKAISCEPSFELADTVSIGQPEEEMSAPPGFDIPQRCLSEKAVSVSSKCDVNQASDTLADSALESILDEYPQGPHVDDSENKAGDVLTASNTVGFHISLVPTLKSSSGEGEPSHGPDDGKVDAANDPEVSPIKVSDTAETSRVTLKVDEQSQGDVGDPNFDAAATSNLKSKQDEELHGPNDNTSELESGDAPAASCVVGSDTVVTSTLESREEGCHGPDGGIAAPNAGNVPTTSPGVGSNTIAISSPELKKNEECYGPDNVNAEHDAGNAPSMLRVLGSITPPSSSLESVEKEVPHGLVDGYEEKDAGDTLLASHAVGSDSLVTSSLESEEKDGGRAELCVNDAPTTSCTSGFDTATVSTLGSKEKAEFQDGNAELDAVDAPPAFSVGFDGQTGSTLESKVDNECHGIDDVNACSFGHDTGDVCKGSDSTTASISVSKEEEEEVCYGRDVCNAKQDVGDAPIASKDVCNNTADASTMEDKDQERSRGADIGNDELDAGDAPTVSFVIPFGNAELGVGDAPSDSCVVTDTTASLEEGKKEECCGLDVSNSEQDASDATIATCVSNINVTAVSVLEDKEQLHDGPAVGNADQDEATTASRVVDTDTTAASILEENKAPDAVSAEQNDLDAHTASCGVGTDTTAASTLEAVEQGEHNGLNVGNDMQNAVLSASFVVGTDRTAELTQEKKAFRQDHGRDVANADAGAPATSCVVGSDTTAASTMEQEEQGKSHDVGNVEQDADDSPTASCVVDTDTAAAPTLDEEDLEPHELDVDNAGQEVDDAPLASCAVNTDTAPVSTLGQSDQEEHDEPDAGNAEQDTVIASADSCVAATNIAAAVRLEENDLEEHHEPNVGSAKQDADDAPNQEEHHELDIRDAECDADKALGDSYAGNNTATAANPEEDYQDEHDEPGVGDAEQHAIDALLASCDVGIDTTSASTLEENDKEEHHELDVGNAEQAADTAPIDTCVVGSDTVATAMEEGYDQVEYNELGNAEQHADNARPASCDVGTNTTPASILEKKDLEEHHEPNVGNAEQAADNAPAISCTISTVAATASTAEEKHQEEHHGPNLCHAEQNVDDVHTASCVNTDATAASNDAPTASCGVGTDTTAASGDAPTASCGLSSDITTACGDAPTASCGAGSNTTTASCDTPAASFVVCTDNTMESVDAPSASCVAPDTATALTLKENDHEESTGPDLRHAEQNVDDVHAPSCVVNADATAASDDALIASCGVGRGTISASGDAPTASCGVRPDTAAASYDTPTASFVVCTDNTTESSDAPSASCVVATDTATALTLKENDNEESTGPDLCHAEENVDDVHEASFAVNMEAIAASDDAPTASCGHGTDTILASGDAPTASCGVGTDTAATSCDTPTASFVVCTDNTMESSDAPSTFCAVPDTAAALTLKENDNDKSIDATAESGDAPTASCGLGTDTAAASLDTPRASFAVVTDNTTESSDAPSTSCVVAPDAATALTLKDNDDEESTGLDLCHAEQDVDNIHATSCVVNADAATSDDAPTASCGVGADAIAASDDAPAASCGVGAAASCDTPAASFAVCTNNTMESGNAPSASCVIAPDTATALTLEDNDIEESAGCKNGNEEHGALDASAISSSNDLTNSTFNAEQ